jgi:hypothetical protein
MRSADRPHLVSEEQKPLQGSPYQPGLIWSPHSPPCTLLPWLCSPPFQPLSSFSSFGSTKLTSWSSEDPVSGLLVSYLWSPYHWFYLCIASVVTDKPKIANLHLQPKVTLILQNKHQQRMSLRNPTSISMSWVVLHEGGPHCAPSLNSFLLNPVPSLCTPWLVCPWKNSYSVSQSH